MVLGAVVVDGFENVFVEVLLGDGVLLAVLVQVNVSVDSGPGQWVVETGEEVDESPGDDHVVVERDQVSSEDRGDTDTGKTGVQLGPYADVTLLEHLTESELEHHHWDTKRKKAQEVRDKECGATPLVA